MAHLPFFRKGVVAAQSDVTMFTQALITERFVEVSAALQIDAPMVGAGHVLISVVPQTSNDLADWSDMNPNFTPVQPVSSFPLLENIKLTDIGRYMRFKVGFLTKGTIIGATISILADGKVDGEVEGADYAVAPPAFLNAPLTPAAAPAPLAAARVKMPPPGSGVRDVTPIIPGGGAIATGSGGMPGTGSGLSGGGAVGPGSGPQIIIYTPNLNGWAFVPKSA